MPKPATNPTLLDEVLQINISKLKEWGYLDPYSQRSGTVDWSRNGIKHSSISIRTHISDDEKYLELDYKANDEPRNYKVQIVSVPSNLGKGSVWYFLCPQTYKRCRKLYLVGGYFLHREAFKQCMYKSQTYTKNWRDLENIFGSYFDIDNYYEQLYSKHFKKYYKGKPTKKYLNLLQKINQAESHSVQDIERLLVTGK